MSKAAELAKMGEVVTNNQVGGRRNILINGAMNVAQRGTSSTGLGASAGYFTLDRWKMDFNATAGRLTMSQTADGPSGFANCLKLDCTTADTSIAAGEYIMLEQRLEGQDVQGICKGTADAKPVTVSFYVKANGSFTFGLELSDNDNTRQITKLFSTTTSWVRHEITFPADTTGAFDDDNARSLLATFWLHAGSTYSGGTLNSSSWASRTHANRAAGISSFFSSTDNEFYITGVQMEIGSTATPFEHRSYAEELTLCQRYYEVVFQGSTAGADFSSYFPWVGLCQGSKSDQINYLYDFKVQKRAPGGTSINETVSSGYEMYNFTTQKTGDTMGTNSNNMELRRGLWWLGGSQSGITEQSGWALRIKSTDCFLALDSEL